MSHYTKPVSEYLPNPSPESGYVSPGYEAQAKLRETLHNFIASQVEPRARAWGCHDGVFITYPSGVRFYLEVHALDCQTKLDVRFTVKWSEVGTLSISVLEQMGGDLSHVASVVRALDGFLRHGLNFAVET